MKEVVCRKNEIPGRISVHYRSKQYSCLYKYQQIKHRDITWHARRGSKWKLFTAGKFDKIGDGLSHSPQNFPKYFANDTMILKMSQDSWYIPHQTTAAGM